MPVFGFRVPGSAMQDVAYKDGFGMTLVVIQVSTMPTLLATISSRLSKF